jgi:large subunit ribosomal protein L18
MKDQARNQRKKPIRAKLKGTQKRPRLNVFRSNLHIYASLVDDHSGKILISTKEKDIKSSGKKPKKERAFLVGKTLGEKAIKKGFKEVVFDRAGYLYHGRIKKLAEGAREAGLKF